MVKYGEKPELEAIYKRTRDKSDGDGELVVRLLLQGWSKELIEDFNLDTEEEQEEYLEEIGIYMTLYAKISKAKAVEPYEARFLKLWDAAMKLVFGHVDPKMFEKTYKKQGFSLQEYAIITCISITFAKVYKETYGK